jgi:hypothetical protein
MRPISFSTLCLLLSVAAFYSLTTTLTDMTKADCRAGIEKACQQLERDGVKISAEGR